MFKFRLTRSGERAMQPLLNGVKVQREPWQAGVMGQIQREPG